jgi:hypothetical protein
LNHDGFQDVNEPGIASVLVTLQTPTGTLTTTTDASGLYTFTNLISGTYVVSFTTPAPLPVSSGAYTGTLQDQFANDAGDSDINPTTGATAPVVVNAAQTVTNVDAGFWQPANLGNRVWEDLDNDGIQEAGEPGIPNALVTPQTPTGTITTTTDPGGFYTLPSPTSSAART